MAQEFKPAPQVQNTKQQQESCHRSARAADVNGQSSPGGRVAVRRGPAFAEIRRPTVLDERASRTLCPQPRFNLAVVRALLRGEFTSILRDSFRSEGLDISKWRSPHVVAEPSFDKARSRGYPALMTLARDNLVATISQKRQGRKRCCPDRLESIGSSLLARPQGIWSRPEKFGDFAPMDDIYTAARPRNWLDLIFISPLPTRQKRQQRGVRRCWRLARELKSTRARVR